MKQTEKKTSPATETPIADPSPAFFDQLLDALSDAEGGSGIAEEAASLISIAQERVESETQWFDGAPQIYAIQCFLNRSRDTLALFASILRTMDEARQLLTAGIEKAYTVTFHERDRIRAALGKNGSLGEA